MTQPIRTHAKFAKVDEALNLVFGWAIVTKVDGEPYFDTQGDHIPDEVMLASTTDYALNSGAAKAMHVGPNRGRILFQFPMTEEIAKAFDIDTGGQYGLLVGARFDPDVVSKFKSGDYTGFSIGGWYGESDPA